jgi:phosphohistidine phosphatase
VATKSLLLLRHAKAIDGGVLILDQDRPLSNSGVEDAKKLGKYLLKKSFDIDLILSSSAIRAISTAQIVANKLGYKQKHLEVEERLYMADVEVMLRLISLIPKKVDTLMIVGHNPGMSSLASTLTGASISMSTCALIELALEIKNWDQASDVKECKFNILN